LPLVVKHLSNEEIHNLVGDIMGKRSADLIVQIMTMAVQNLDRDEREEMVKYMKESMAGTFFDRWLSMTGWSGSSQTETTNGIATPAPAAATCISITEDRKRPAKDTAPVKDSKRGRREDDATDGNAVTITSQAELEKLIRAIATNSSLTPEQRNTTIQGLRDSVWRSNQQQRRLSDETLKMSHAEDQRIDDGSQTALIAAHSKSSTRGADPRRVTPPSKYFRKNDGGVIECISLVASSPIQVQMPLFTPSELAPTYHDGAAGAVLGCPHYARACKLRHPVSGRLYTCRLCCAQHRELQTKDQEEPLDRYAVTEVLCMICNALQPSSKGCINSDCESYGRPFAKYFCRICNLFDDSSRPAFHCPYCNACRRGHGLGQDYRHCMRCNACISLSEKEHQCIPQKLQGNCPICSESLFESTVQLRGLKCGHVMHLSCFEEYRRSQSHTCPLCKKSVEDMSEYFSLLDAAVRMQPMPIYLANTMSNIYCQDCEQQGQTKYHLVGLKCTNCNSYNTRELNRVQLGAATESPR
jgi:Zinc-ribbon/CHY zinc finger/Ring finger domain